MTPILFPYNNVLTVKQQLSQPTSWGMKNAKFTFQAEMLINIIIMISFHLFNFI